MQKIKKGGPVAKPRLGKSTTGVPMHYSVGALIVQDERYLLIERATPPLGWAGPAGHVDQGEGSKEAISREVAEETGLTVTTTRLLFSEEVEPNVCGEGISCHYWYLYACTVTGGVVADTIETKGYRWVTAEELRAMARKGLLEPVWYHWFAKLDLVSPEMPT